MKKFGAILLLLIYTSTALGAFINFHFCKGHLSRVSVLNIGGNNGCGCNPDAMPKGCCEDKLISGNAGYHNSVEAVYTINRMALVPELSPVINRSDLILYSTTLSIGNFQNFVQRSWPVPVYLLNSVFRI